MSKQTITQLKDSASRLSKIMTTAQTYMAVIKESERILGSVSGSIYMNLNGDLKRVYTTIPVNERIESRRRGFTYKAFHKKEILIIEASEFKKVHPEFTPLNVGQILLLPLVYNGESIGILSLQISQNKPISKKDFDLIWLFSSLVSIRLRNTLLHEQWTNALKARDLFISLALHELSTPITTLTGYISLLNKKLDDKNKNYINSVNAQITRLNQIISKLVKFNQIRDDVKVSSKRFNIKQAINRAVIDFKSIFPSYQIIINEELEGGNLKINGDLYKISQMFLSILENSAKFSNDINPIQIKLKKETDLAVIAISDKGVGINKSEQKRVLNGHYKAGGNTQQGFGIGLYLTKIIAESHGGTINLKSKLGEGTEVAIKLPILEK